MLVAQLFKYWLKTRKNSKPRRSLGVIITQMQFIQGYAKLDPRKVIKSRLQYSQQFEVKFFPLPCLLINFLYSKRLIIIPFWSCFSAPKFTPPSSPLIIIALLLIITIFCSFWSNLGGLNLLRMQREEGNYYGHYRFPLPSFFSPKIKTKCVAAGEKKWGFWPSQRSNEERAKNWTFLVEYYLCRWNEYSRSDRRFL